MKIKINLVLSLLFLCILGVVSSVSAQDLLPRDNGLNSYHNSPRYRESESHPLRILAYVVHPVGWALREGIFRPLSAFVASTATTRSIFGFREPFDYREPNCFTSSDAVPDCRKLSPFINITDTPGDLIFSDEEQTNGGLGKQVYIPDVNFEFNKSSLNDLGRGRVRQISQLLSSVPNLTVTVEGHTDPKGSEKYNEALGARRAEVVVKELSELGVDPSRMSQISLGESKPIFTEDQPWANAVNRRVQFSVKGAS